MEKALVSFEFMIPLAAIVLLTGALIPGILEESRESIVQSSVKSSISSHISNLQFEDQNCNNPYIESYKVIKQEDTTQLIFKIQPEECEVEGLHEITSRIEEEICGGEPVSNNRIICGDKIYEVIVE
ncbi:MAG: hypothetical protein ACOCTT_00300 [archaeon]